jgi:hypothetical protein
MYCVLVLCTSANGQKLSVGVVAGTNITDDVQSGTVTSSGGLLPSGQTQTYTNVFAPGARRPIFGLLLEYRLPRNWAVEFDVLHRELKSTETELVSPAIIFPDGHSLSILGTVTGTLTPWEFPILAKYRLPVGRFRPFLTAGPSFRPAGSGTGLSHAGVTAGGGVEFQAGGLRIAPTVRYTHWATNDSYSPAGSPLPNQVEFLVGFDHPSTSQGVSAFGRRLSIGLIAGIGLGKDFKVGSLSPQQTPEANSGIYGAMLETSLPKDWALEVDGLYRPLHGGDVEFGQPVRFAHLTWEFPVLAKYRFPGNSRIRPFVEGGPSFRAEGNLNLAPVSHFGGTAGAGVEAKLYWLKVSPMLRYTRWSGQASNVSSQAWTNQTQVLVSFSH